VACASVRKDGHAKEILQREVQLARSQKPASSQSFTDLGIPNESLLRAAGINAPVRVDPIQLVEAAKPQSSFTERIMAVLGRIRGKPAAPSDDDDTDTPAKPN
jgi:hypothetical protein